MLCATAWPLAAQNYWPLDPGNLWVYRTTDRGFVRLQVARTETVAGNTYGVLTGLPTGEAWLRTNEDGVVFNLDPTTRREGVWYNFAAGAGETYDTTLPNANGRAQLRTRNESFRGRIGQFSNALAIQYLNSNSAPGLARELFLPYVGPVQRSFIGGIQASEWELVYASLGGVTFISQPETAFGIGVEGSSVRLTLKHTGPQPLDLTFPSSQLYNIAVYDDRGQAVWNWASTRLFAAVLTMERITGERTWMEALPNLPPGNYAVEAFLTTAGGPVFRATAPVTIGPPPRP
ncbi:MAG: BsuPI-related putative proteinase inhibitor [Acidobacteria bacterium]|nr:BsuPI-related putative proteinase inhibitor [Acidobacteriota bacterium]